MFRYNRSRLILVCAFGLVAAGGALANDGGISLGGSPDLLTQHPTISMESEVIRLTVTDKKVTADCTFKFRNRGAACTVRMGFPDIGRGSEDPDEEDMEMKQPPRSTFDSFRSYVDGKPVKTELIRSKHEGELWHAKLVHFPANAALTVRDVYTQDVGAKIAEHSSVNQVGYTLHTGASWHGPIGRSDVEFSFQRSGLAAFRTARKGNGIEHDTQLLKHPGEIYYQGPCAPELHDKSVRFVRANWRPTAQDDIILYFGARRLSQN